MIHENIMPLIQFRIPDDLNKCIKIYMAENNIDDKRIAIKQILREKFKITFRQGIKNLLE